jgi:Mg-chelatase subunit ChlD
VRYLPKLAPLAAAAVVLSFGGLVLLHSARPVDAKVSPSPAVQEPAPANVSPQANPQPVLENDPRQAIPEPAVMKAPPSVDIVFALDTTGSMGGLIAGAKAKIWEIARLAQEGKPTPKLRLGLVAYRDRGDEYVTRVLDLTSDMDKAYATLSDFVAAGGGDGPEHVIKGLHDAVDKVTWSSDPGAVKIVYLVGDAPPHFDYNDGLTLKGVLADATQRGVVINAIRCGNDDSTLAAWKSIASATHGDVATIESSGGVAVVTTPYDAELARLNADLTKTEVRYGSAAERRDADEVVRKNLAAPAAAQADRAAFYESAAASKAAPTKHDLAAAPSASAVAAIPTTDLPDELQAMGREARVAYVQQKQKDREEVLARMRDVNEKREAWLKTSAPAPAPTSFDSKVYSSLKRAGASKGVSF